ncbi:AraC family transcriptional regulator [bacterium D16-50]|jgi:AraC-type DNA-binding domain-containing proteins|nr:AraC family transcriptional regulator [bacterium D16-50]
MTDSVFSIDNVNINIKYALFVEHDKNWHEVKAKNEYAFWIILSGSFNIEYKQDKYTLSVGDVFFFYPQVLYYATSSEGCSFFFIHFDAILGNNYQALHFYPFDGYFSHSKIKDSLISLTDSVYSLHQKEIFAELRIHGSLLFFLSYIMKMKYQEGVESAYFPANSALARLQPVLIYINHHLDEPIYIQKLAYSINLSEKYFISFFKKTMGMTPTSYITQVKMKKALEYLHEQNYSVKEVSALVGYADIYTFSKAFKKTYGISPSNFSCKSTNSQPPASPLPPF